MRAILLAMACTLCAALPGSSVEALTEEERMWDKKTIEVLDSMYDTYSSDIETLKRERASSAAADKKKSQEDYRRLTRNVAVRVSHLVIMHPLGDGQQRLRLAFERSKFRELMQWQHLFAGENADLLEDEDL
eukprot:TRINITY_DN9315_c0_g1_i1.p4 TRINITY_DN9315_c0_g1~~TRINITY_DN9315_c0_g1_i1.p4  ORF type:complete len:132 (+),score=27.14 TRINITY_DN9315_c0_g1_i1:1243-1638(+)